KDPSSLLTAWYITRLCSKTIPGVSPCPYFSAWGGRDDACGRTSIAQSRPIHWQFFCTPLQNPWKCIIIGLGRMRSMGRSFTQDLESSCVRQINALQWQLPFEEAVAETVAGVFSATCFTLTGTLAPFGRRPACRRAAQDHRPFELFAFGRIIRR